MIRQHIQAMGGGAQSHLMLGMDDQLYVVKFKNNPQATRVLANEFMGTRLAAAVGLSVPRCDIVEVTPWLVQGSADLRVRLAHSTEPFHPGLQFGSQHVGGILPGLVEDYVTEQELLEVRNLAEFAGMLVIDKWACNVDGRQAVFAKKGREKRYTAFFVDQGYCFNAGEWIYRDVTLRGVYPRNIVYAHVSGWQDFEPWLSRVEHMSASIIWEIAEAVPPEWYGGDRAEIEQLVEGLLKRRLMVRSLIEAFRDSDRTPFPMWSSLQSTEAGMLTKRLQ